MTIKRLAISIFVLGILYAYCVAGEDQYQRALQDTTSFWQEIAKADAARAEKFRLGQADR